MLLALGLHHADPIPPAHPMTAAQLSSLAQRRPVGCARRRSLWDDSMFWNVILAGLTRQSNNLTRWNAFQRQHKGRYAAPCHASLGYLICLGRPLAVDNSILACSFNSSRWRRGIATLMGRFQPLRIFRNPVAVAQASTVERRAATDGSVAACHTAKRAPARSLSTCSPLASVRLSWSWLVLLVFHFFCLVSLLSFLSLSKLASGPAP